MNSIAMLAQKSGARLEEFMPTIAPIHCVKELELPLVEWAQGGVKMIVWDVEATMGVTGEKELDPPRLAMVDRARELGILHHVITTNLNVGAESRKNRALLAGWGEQMGADLCLFPQKPRQRKPSPYMARVAMQFFDLAGHETAAVGDKATADVRAARRAGIDHIAWTKPFGPNRAWGDRLGRAPLESMLRVQAHLRLTPKLEVPRLTEQEVHGFEILDYADLANSGDTILPDGQDRIVGLGIEDIVLDTEVLDALHRPDFRTALESLKSSFDRYGELPKQYLQAFLYENGRATADGLVLARLLCALGIVAVNISDVSDIQKNKFSVALAGVGYATDSVDGYAARRDKFGATKKGAADDQNVDKLLSVIIDTFPLIRRELISKPDFGITLLREFGLTVGRRPFKQRGIDTKSVSSGKWSTLLKGGAQGFGLLLGGRYPTTARRLQTLATIAKVGSALHAPVSWIDQHELHQHEQLEELHSMLDVVSA